MLPNVPFWIILSGNALIPSRGAGVPEEAFLRPADPPPHPSLLDRVRGARDARRPDAGRHRVGDPLGPDDGDEMAREDGVDGAHRRRASPRAGPSGPEDRLSSHARRMGSGDEASNPIPGGHRGGPRAESRSDSHAGAPDPGALSAARDPDRRR